MALTEFETFSRSVAADAVRTVGDRAVGFARLTRADIGGLLVRWVNAERQRRTEICKQAGVDAAATAKQLVELDEEAGTPYWGFVKCGRLDRAVEVVTLSANKGGVAEVDWSDWIPTEIVDLACELWDRRMHYRAFRLPLEKQGEQNGPLARSEPASAATG